MHRFYGLALIATGFMVLGCGPTVDPPRSVDGGQPTADAGSDPVDGGAEADAGTATDTGQPADTGLTADSGPSADTGVAADAGPQGPQACGGPIETPCPEGSICVKNDGLCDGRPNGQMPTGTCRPVVAQCPEAAEGDAVCGCGGATYASRCHAQLYGEDVAAVGVCQDQMGFNRCSAAGGPDCGRGDFYCATPLGHCDAVAFCMPNPDMCRQEEGPDRGSPVCDCNGNEHHNLCNARMAEESIRNVGPCR